MVRVVTLAFKLQCNTINLNSERYRTIPMKANRKRNAVKLSKIGTQVMVRLVTTYGK